MYNKQEIINAEAKKKGLKEAQHCLIRYLLHSVHMSCACSTLCCVHFNRQDGLFLLTERGY